MKEKLVSSGILASGFSHRIVLAIYSHFYDRDFPEQLKETRAEMLIRDYCQNYLRDATVTCILAEVLVSWSGWLQRWYASSTYAL